MAEYGGPYPVPAKWRDEHIGEQVSFTYRMSLDDLYESEGIEGMNDYLDSVLGTIMLSDISYEFAYDEDDQPSKLDALIKATGTIEDI